MENKRRVNVKYQYYQLCAFDGDNYTENLYDLLEWMGRVSVLPIGETVHEVDGVEGRLEKIKPLHNNQFYTLNFMRLDVVSNTYIVTKDEEARHIDLEENEYIGKNTVMLYDPNYSIAMVQCNRGGYGVVSIQNYINSFNHNGELCYFRPIDAKLDIDELSKSAALKLDVRFANIRRFNANSKFFERIINSCAEIECVTAHIECSLGYTKCHELSKETVYEVVSDLQAPENRDAISSAKIKLNSDQKSDIIDIFENIFNDTIGFIIPPRKELDFSLMTSEMLKQYYEKGSRNKLYRILE